jgi:arylsulfatase A-like enzyme
MKDTVYELTLSVRQSGVAGFRLKAVVPSTGCAGEAVYLKKTRIFSQYPYCFFMKKIPAICLLICAYSFSYQGKITHTITGKNNKDRRPNIILIMSDDQGWGQTGYYHHPVLATPNLDEMARQGLRMDRFYAGAPVCSPTRASVLTGRSNDRSAVYSVGYPIRRQEKTIAQALKNAGYHTAHFGKWHLDGLKGPGVPILASDERNPGYLGFEEWLSTSNYFDMNPLLSRRGKFESYTGGSSEVVVSEALKYIRSVKNDRDPFFVVIWLGSPHEPWTASDADKKAFAGLDSLSQNHYGELVEMDRNIGVLRQSLRAMGIADNTLVWFNSDNGGLKNFGPETVGGLRGFKGDVYEGGLRVPCIIEWPSVIKPHQSNFPGVTMDIFPTIADILKLPEQDMPYPVDGISLQKLFTAAMATRQKGIGFRYMGKAAWIDNQYKLVKPKAKADVFELYDLEKDPYEKNNLIEKEPKIAASMMAAFSEWSKGVDKSVAGADYPGGLAEKDPQPRSWLTAPEYKPFLELFNKRPEYKNTKATED